MSNANPLNSSRDCSSSSADEGGGSNSNGGGGGQGTESSDGEEQEESSSSSHTTAIPAVETELANFRQQWRRELETSPHKTGPQPKLAGKGNPVQKLTEEEPEEAKARQLFLTGVKLEQDGKLYEAIQYYRKAVQIVPDIEFRTFDAMRPKVRERTETEMSNDTVNDNIPGVGGESDEDDSDPDDMNKDLVMKFQRHYNRNQCLCKPQVEQKGTHISALPMEVLLYVLKWMVSADLDLRSLEIFSRVCRGFYLTSRDPEIWRLACLRVWGVNCGSQENYGSWRQMFMERPRLQFNGCYISKTTYVRHGENSFQDQFYRPWHLVEYFRYIRFFSDGSVHMLTTPDDPMSALSHLRFRTSRHPAVLVGHFRLSGTSVTMLLKRQQQETSRGSMNNRFRHRASQNHDPGVQNFHIELQIQPYRKRNNSQLVWTHYAVHTCYRSGQESISTFDLCGTKFPPFWFSRVKSYAAESEIPLQ